MTTHKLLKSTASELDKETQASEFGIKFNINSCLNLSDLFTANSYSYITENDIYYKKFDALTYNRIECGSNYGYYNRLPYTPLDKLTIPGTENYTINFDKITDEDNYILIHLLFITGKEFNIYLNDTIIPDDSYLAKNTIQKLFDPFDESSIKIYNDYFIKLQNIKVTDTLTINNSGSSSSLDLFLSINVYNNNSIFYNYIANYESGLKSYLEVFNDFNTTKNFIYNPIKNDNKNIVSWNNIDYSENGYILGPTKTIKGSILNSTEFVTSVLYPYTFNCDNNFIGIGYTNKTSLVYTYIDLIENNNYLINCIDSSSYTDTNKTTITGLPELTELSDIIIPEGITKITSLGSTENLAKINNLFLPSTLQINDFLKTLTTIPNIFWNTLDKKITELNNITYLKF